MKGIEDQKNKRGKEDWQDHEFPVPATHLTPEQILTWLDGWREFMFEVWKKNPELREAYLKQRRV